MVYQGAIVQSWWRISLFDGALATCLRQLSPIDFRAIPAVKITHLRSKDIPLSLLAFHVTTAWSRGVFNRKLISVAGAQNPLPINNVALNRIFIGSKQSCSTTFWMDLRHLENVPRSAVTRSTIIVWLHRWKRESLLLSSTRLYKFFNIELNDGHLVFP